MLLHKGFEATYRKVTPDEGTLAKVRQAAGREVKAEDLFCGKMRVCNDQVDRAHERFTKAYLERFRDTLPGKSVMIGHDYKQPPKGRFYDAQVVKDGDVHHLEADFFVDAQDTTTVRAIELGVYKDVSVGFRAGGMACDLCGKSYVGTGKDVCQHQAGEEYDGQLCTVTYTDEQKAEAMEASFVWLGCQYGATITGSSASITQTKAAEFGTPKPAPKENAMTLEEALAENATLKAAGHDPARMKELQTENERLKPVAADGQAFRKFLRDDILRLAGLIGDGELAEKTAILDALGEDVAASRLEPLWKGLQAKVNEVLGPRPGGGSTAGPPPTPNPNGEMPLKTVDPFERRQRLALHGR